jgi:large subunit ribosomal protein L18
MAKATTQSMRKRRHRRLRKRLSGTTERPRLCVYRSNMHIYAQVIDDTRGYTLVSASTKDRQAQQDMAKLERKVARAEAVGKLVAERALQAGISRVVFDRGGFDYHGRVSALAEAARKAGLEF